MYHLTAFSSNLFLMFAVEIVMVDGSQIIRLDEFFKQQDERKSVCWLSFIILSISIQVVENFLSGGAEPDRELFKFYFIKLHQWKYFMQYDSFMHSVAESHFLHYW